MDEVLNPYAPGAGTPPPEMVGRDDILRSADVCLRRVLSCQTDQGILLTGLRGVGKTVLLNKLHIKAEVLGYHADFIEATDDKSMAAMLLPGLRKATLRFSQTERLKDLSTTALRILKSFSLSMKVGEADVSMGIDPLAGYADSGDVAHDLVDVFKHVGALAKAAERGIGIFIDELQYLTQRDYAALIVAAHRASQLQLPIVVMGAGLPMLPALSGEAKSYAERLFRFPRIGVLQPEDAQKAIVEPARRRDVNFSDEALARIVTLTGGYPYFLQEWGYETWNIAPRAPIVIEDVNSATPRVLKKLDESFFRVRFERATEAEKRYLRALAELGPGEHASGEVAALMKKKSTGATGPVRDTLIKKGMVYAPRYGFVEFTVPLFDEFLRRTIPNAVT